MPLQGDPGDQGEKGIKGDIGPKGAMVSYIYTSIYTYLTVIQVGNEVHHSIYTPLSEIKQLFLHTIVKPIFAA